MAQIGQLVGPNDTVVISARLDVGMAADLQRLAEERGVTVDELIAHDRAASEGGTMNESYPDDDPTVTAALDGHVPYVPAYLRLAALRRRAQREAGRRVARSR